MTDSAQRRLLLVFAHPDDESVFAGGLARRTVAEGGSVALCTATPGEHGKVGDPPVCPRERLAFVRQAELMAACAELGIGPVRVLGYPDRGLAFAPTDTIRRQLVELVRAMRPRVVVTFDPNGSNLHPDHVAISRFTSDAVAAAADARWFPDLGAPHAVARLLWTLPVRPWEVLRRTDPALEAGIDFALDVSSHTGSKIAALRAHRTQHQSLTRVFFSKPDVLRLLGVEMFRQAFGPPLRTRPAADVFADIAPSPDSQGDCHATDCHHPGRTQCAGARADRGPAGGDEAGRPDCPDGRTGTEARHGSCRASGAAPHGTG